MRVNVRIYSGNVEKSHLQGYHLSISNNQAQLSGPRWAWYADATVKSVSTRSSYPGLVLEVFKTVGKSETYKREKWIVEFLPES